MENQTPLATLIQHLSNPELTCNLSRAHREAIIDAMSATLIALDYNHAPEHVLQFVAFMFEFLLSQLNLSARSG